MKTDGLRRSYGLFVVLIVIGMVLLAMPVQVIWAMPPQSPDNQTVPPTPGRKGGGERPGPEPTPTCVPAGGSHEAKIGPNGGELSFQSCDGGGPGCVLIQIRPGTLAEEILFNVTLANPVESPPDTCDDPNATDPLCKATVAYTLKAWRTASGQLVSSSEKFSSTYSHVICYTEADLLRACNGDADYLVIAYYDEQAGKWVPLVTTADKANHNVGALTDHSTGWWALMARPCPKIQLPVTGADNLPERLPETGGSSQPFSLWFGLSALLGLALIAVGVVGLYRRSKTA